MSKDSQGQTIGAIIKGLLVFAVLVAICVIAFSAIINSVSGSITVLFPLCPLLMSL